MTATPKVAAIHDLSGYGRCSLTVALPILSVMGVQCSVLPTAYLSAHTAFPGFTFLDLTEEMKKTMGHWEALGLQFDAVYSGFLGGVEQIDIVADFIRRFRREGGLAIVDPVMGDYGRRYVTYTDEMCEATRRLAEKADVITPNLTEAAFLLEEAFDALPADRAGLAELTRRLSCGGGRSVVLTGASDGEATIGAAVYDRETDRVEFALTDRIPGEYHGTGDVFASVLTGALLRGRSLVEASALAVRFVRDCAARTYPLHTPPQEGVDFEPLLYTIAADRL